MSRRLAHRTASRAQHQNISGDAGSAHTLATKVFHYPCQSFSCAGGGQPGHGQAVRRPSTGVGAHQRCGGARRIEWGEQLGLTLFGRVALVTKEIHGGKA
jgi:hypothetical protein